jgi:hypothetical protein
VLLSVGSHLALNVLALAAAYIFGWILMKVLDL